MCGKVPIYHPKDYDADCLEGMKDDLKGDVMLTDNHYSTLLFWKRLKVTTGIRKSPRKELTDHSELRALVISSECTVRIWLHNVLLRKNKVERSGWMRSREHLSGIKGVDNSVIGNK